MHILSSWYKRDLLAVSCPQCLPGPPTSSSSVLLMGREIPPSLPPSPAIWLQCPWLPDTHSFLRKTQAHGYQALQALSCLAAAAQGDFMHGSPGPSCSLHPPESPGFLERGSKRQEHLAPLLPSPAAGPPHPPASAAPLTQGRPPGGRWAQCISSRLMVPSGGASQGQRLECVYPGEAAGCVRHS